MPQLIHSRVDSQSELVKRRGRMAVERDLAASPHHLRAAIQEHQEQMITGMKSQGLEYVDEYGFELEGPFHHLSFADDSTADPGPQSRPQPHRPSNGSARRATARR